MANFYKMCNDGRNFRSSYYDKELGVEEQKSLNKLLPDPIRNHARLKQFALRYTVPTAVCHAQKTYNERMAIILWKLSRCCCKFLPRSFSPASMKYNRII